MLTPPAPGNSLGFTGTVTPAGTVTSIDDIGWAIESSDGSQSTMTSNADDPTGMTATMQIDPAAASGSIITYWCVLRLEDAAQTEIIGGLWSITVV
jgi:hypothetical protein